MSNETQSWTWLTFEENNVHASRELKKQVIAFVFTTWQSQIALANQQPFLVRKHEIRIFQQPDERKKQIFTRVFIIFITLTTKDVQSTNFTKYRVDYFFQNIITIRTTETPTQINIYPRRLNPIGLYSKNMKSKTTKIIICCWI